MPDGETTGKAGGKTWERTKTPGLLRHRSGLYYARLTSGGKTEFRPLKTNLLEIARIRFSKQKALVEKTRRARRKAGMGAATMADLLALLRTRLSERAGVSPRTRELNLQAVAYLVRTWPEVPALRPDEITVTAVLAWRDRALSDGSGYRPPGAKGPRTFGRSASAFNKAVSVLRQALDIAVDTGASHANPIAGRRGIRAPDRPRKPRLPETAKLHEVFAEIERVGGRGPKSAEFCRLLAYTGLRRGEARGLVIGDLDFGRGIIHVRGTKTEGSNREVPMIPAARALLATLVARRGAEAAEAGIDHGPTSAVLAVGEAQKSLDRACAVVGVPRLTHHDLRDAFATTCIESGVDIPTVAAWLGHVDGGALLMRVYAHHRRKHSIEQAAKVGF